MAEIMQAPWLLASKWTGTTAQKLNPAFQYKSIASEAVISCLFACLSILAVRGVHAGMPFGSSFPPLQQDASLILGSFGATAVLLCHAIDSPLAQPANLILGHTLSAMVGVTISKIFSTEWVSLETRSLVAPALAVALSILVMGLTGTMHPPGGATSLIAVISSSEIQDLGFSYALRPVLTGAGTMLVCALVLNNIVASRNYPQYWVPPLWSSLFSHFFSDTVFRRK
ncbi:HPP family-domain-containing protein [Chytriomyces sp. MP71]|nr:HPP family-domain-containing protein [Chytriomyces sp. MP71]